MTTTSSMSAWARLFRGARRRPVLSAAIALVALLCVSLIAVYVALQTEPGRTWLARSVESVLSGPGREVAIGRIEGRLPAEIRIDELTVGDRAGTWLTVRRLALDWSPLSLVRGRLEIESAAAREVTIARRPVAGEDAPEARLPGMPPLEVAMPRVTVDTLRLEAPVVGAAANLRVAAEVAVGTEAIRARLDVSRTDAIAGHATAVFGYDPETGSLDLHAELSEPQGGLVARVIELPQLPAVDLSLAGAGPAVDWRGTVTLSAEKLVSLESLLTVSIGGPAARVALEGTARPGPASDKLESLFGPETEFAIAVTRPDRSGSLSISVDRLRSAAIEAAGTGDLALSQGTVRADLRVATRDATRLAPLIAPVRLGTATAEGRLSGPLTHPAVDLDAGIGAVRIGDWSARRIDLHARLRPGGPLGGDSPIRLEGQAALAAFRGPLEELNAALGDSVRITLAQASLEGRARLKIGEATVAGATARGSVSGNVAFETGRIAAHGRLEVDDLSPLSGRAGRALQGRLSSAYDISYDPAGALSMGLDGSLDDGRFGVAAAEALLGPRAAFAGKIDRLGDGHWIFSDVTVDGAGANATGRLSFPPGAAGIEADYGIRVSDLAALDLADPARPGGFLEIRGTAAGPASNPALEGIATLTDAAPAGFALDRLTARYALHGPVAALKGRITLDAETALLQDLSGRIDIALNEQTIELAPLRLTARGTAVSGNLAIPLSGPPLTGALTVKADDLGTWSPVADRQLAGRLEAEATLSADRGRQQVSLTGSVKAFTLDDSVRSQDVSATARVSDALGERRLAASVRSGAGRVGPLRVQDLTADVSGTLSNAAVRLRASGDYRGPLRLEADGTVERDGQRTVLTIAQLTGEVMGAPVALRKPAIADVGPGLETVTVELALADGTVGASLRRTPDDVSLEAGMRSVPLAPFWRDAPPQVESARMNADAALRGPVGRPGGRFNLSLTGIATGELETAPEGLALNIEARLQNNVLVANGRFAGLGKASAEVDAALPVRISMAPVSVGIDGAAPASGNVTYEGPIGPLAALAALDRHRVEGEADIRLKLSGSLRDPRIAGRATLNGGRYENLDTGTVLTDIRLQARPANNGLVIEDATAGDGNGGRIIVTGDVGFGGPGGMSLALDAAFDKARLVRRDELTAVSSGSISLRGDAAKRTIAGRLDIEEAEIRLIGGMTPGVVQIEVEETGTPPAGAPPPPPTTKPSNTQLDVTIAMPKRMFVRGRGLDSEWGGDLHVTGTTASPRIQGSLRPLRGRYDFLGKIFTLRGNSIDFVGAEQIDPALDLSAERRVTDLTAIIRVTGTARSPVIRLDSVPQVPRDEVLSRILFNKSSGRLSATEALQVGQAAAAMTGATSGGGIMDFGRRMLSLDVLQVKRSAETADGADGGETSVEAGKYVTDDVYIGVEGGSAAGTGATVEIEVTPRVRIEGDVGQQEKEKIGIKWKYDY